MQKKNAQDCLTHLSAYCEVLFCPPCEDNARRQSATTASFAAEEGRDGLESSTACTHAIALSWKVGEFADQSYFWTDFHEIDNAQQQYTNY